MPRIHAPSHIIHIPRNPTQLLPHPPSTPLLPRHLRELLLTPINPHAHNLLLPHFLTRRQPHRNFGVFFRGAYAEVAGDPGGDGEEDEGEDAEGEGHVGIGHYVCADL